MSISRCASGELPDSSSPRARGRGLPRSCAQPGLFRNAGTPEKSCHLRNHDCISFEGMTAPDRWDIRCGKNLKWHVGFARG